MSGDAVDGAGAGRPARVEIVERSRGFDGFFKVDRLKLRHERYRGDWSPVLQRELFCQRQAVAVLPFDPVHQRLALIEQFRIGAIDGADRPWVLETAAGLIDREGEPEAIARSELLEECNLVARRMELALRYWASPGATTELVHVFVAEAIIPEVGGVHGLGYEGEDIQTHVLSLDEAFDWLDSGRVTGITAIVALQWLRLHHARLRHAWTGG